MRLIGFMVLIGILMPADPPSQSGSTGFGRDTQQDFRASAYDPYGFNGAGGVGGPVGHNSGFCSRFPQLCLSPAEAIDLAGRKLSYGSRLVGSLISSEQSGGGAAPQPGCL